MSVRENLLRVRERMEDAARRAGRPEGSVTLNAVSKAATLDAIREAVDAGARILGENRIQVAGPKIVEASDLVGRVAWHMIGHLQRNKARRAVELFERIEGVDRLSLARRLSDLGEERGAPVRILAEINVSGEESKGGFPRAEATERVAELRELPGVRLEGLMTMAPYTEDDAAIRDCFRGLREIRDAIPAAEGFTELSMGMTNDFEIAVEEGATMVRVGSAIFG
ncbi:MAG: YggS family pyridoxal phosphate-dependent enzyme [Gemmatimonadetes bacterium]|nr:YggS family pyridoxal phosphate-dependent enzyme [Gemmatimonadota bacterium]